MHDPDAGEYLLKSFSLGVAFWSLGGSSSDGSVRCITRNLARIETIFPMLPFPRDFATDSEDAGYLEMVAELDRRVPRTGAGS
jgi:hypothetical protein